MSDLRSSPTPVPSVAVTAAMPTGSAAQFGQAPGGVHVVLLGTLQLRFDSLQALRDFGDAIVTRCGKLDQQAVDNVRHLAPVAD